MINRSVLVCAAWALGVGVSIAEPTPLGGPAVGGPATRATLVSRGFEGELLPLGAPPAIAALDLLSLDEATEARLHTLLTERARLLDDLVLSNVELLSQVETIMAVGRPAEKLELVQKGLALLEPARAWGRLADRIGGELPEAARARFEALIEEFEEARYASATSAGRVEHRFQHRMTRYWEDLTWEIQRAAERVLEDDGEGDRWLERLTERLGLSPDQEGEIRAMAERFYFDAKGRPTQEQQIAFVGQIRRVLTVEQRWAFTAMILRGELESGDE